MKKIKERAAGTAKLLLLIGAAVYCIVQPEDLRSAVSSAMGRCLGILIPSLYAMLIISSLLIRSGALRVASRVLSPLGKVFAMDGEIFGAFLFSLFAGYPVGGRLLSALVREKRLDIGRAALLAGVCFGAGPAFISGCIGSQLFGSPAAGKVVLLSNLCANAILAIAVSFFLRKAPAVTVRKTGLHLNSGMLTDCTLSAGRSMAEICCMVTAFAAADQALYRSGILISAGELLARLTGRTPQVCTGLLSSALDITAVTRLPAGDMTLLPVISALTAFGGLCVFMQIAAAVRGEFSLLPMIAIRCAGSVLSFIICRCMITEELLLSSAVPAAAVSGAVTSASSPVPSVLLIIMTVTVLRERERLSINN